MGGEGLIGLCEGLRDCATLKILSLASIHLQELDSLACEVRASLLPSQADASEARHTFQKSRKKPV